jgi:alkyldihydroxyacetonephosphate synthase
MAFNSGVRSSLESLLGAAAVSERPVADLWPLGIMRRRAGHEPPLVQVVRPDSAQLVCRLLEWAHGAGVQVIPMGGASGVCGALAPTAGQVVLDLGALDHFEIDEPNLACRAGAGLNGLRLEQALQERGLTLGHYPSSLPVATVGGLLATRSSGQESSRYGNVEDMVMGLEVALPDGSLLAARAAPRSAAGPALHQLWLGAEGRIGVILEAVLRVHRKPETVIGRGFRLASVESGLDGLRAVVQAGIRPLVMRLYDPTDSAFQGLEGEGCLGLIAVAGPGPVAEAEAALVEKLVAGEPLGEAPWERWQRHRFDLSAERLKDLLEPAGSYVDTIEVATSWTQMPALYEDVRSALAHAADLVLCHFSHAYGQGCCAYFTFGGSAPSEDAAQAAYQQAWAGAMTATLRHGGTISHHHGVGQVRQPWLAQEMDGWLQAWDRIQAALA